LKGSPAITSAAPPPRVTDRTDRGDGDARGHGGDGRQVHLADGGGSVAAYLADERVRGGAEEGELAASASAETPRVAHAEAAAIIEGDGEIALVDGKGTAAAAALRRDEEGRTFCAQSGAVRRRRGKRRIGLMPRWTGDSKEILGGWRRRPTINVRP